ncbi:MAG TPA: hypothetical protein VJR58_06890 [Vineibacter sp.]|nr:hypothetical protein [Vineibacter sp.]
MVLPYVKVAALGAVVSGILAGPPPAQAQSVAALSAVGFPIIGGSAVEMATLRSASSAAVTASAGDTAAALSDVSTWSAAGVVITGAVATLVLRDGSGAVQASFVVPARAVAAVGLRAGDVVGSTATEAGTILHKDGRVLAFVTGDDQRHLVRHDALATH